MDISVVIPTYNRAACLSRALASVYGQTLVPREIIVVDDGSSDATAALVSSSFPDTRYLYQRHAGVSAARNRGVAAAKGEWIGFLDSDDEWLAHKLERQADALRAHPACRLIHCDETWLRDGRKLPQKSKHRKRGGWIFERCLPLCAISPSAALLRRTLFDDVGCFDESLPACEDYDLWLRITAHEPVLFVAEPLVIKHGGHADQLSRRIPALDRFRIEVLIKLIESGVLSPSQSKAALATMAEKLTIYINGARKRGRDLEVAHYESIKCRLCPE
jgi:glycosyltransferase involved in cell wall biosynthesis